VKREVDGTLVPLPLLIKSANREMLGEIQQEITDAQGLSIRGEKEDVPDNKLSALQLRLYYLLPAPLRVVSMKITLSRPFLRRNLMGTAMLTSIGSKRRIPGWFVHTSYHNLSFGVGSVIRKPRAVGEETRVREILNLTILMDHDVVDGVPMARFVADLTHQLEGGSGLKDSESGMEVARDRAQE
jgi:hypothetical protein